MDGHAWVTLATLLGATVLLLGGWIPMAATALLVPVVLALTGTVTPEVALAGFGNHAAISIGATFVVGAGLKESGLATLLARALQRVGGRRETVLLALVLLSGAALSAWMSNAATVAMLLPVCVAVSRRALIEPSRLLMPMAFAVALGGTVTLMGTQPNFLVAEYAKRLPGEQFGFFDFTPVGLAIVAVGVLTLLLVGRRLVRPTSTAERLAQARVPEEVAASYGLAQDMFLMRISEGSPLAGRTIAEAGIRARYDLTVMVVRRDSLFGDRWLGPRAGLLLEAGDLLYVEGDDRDAWAFAEAELCLMGLAGPNALESVLGRGITLVEVTVAPGSDALGLSFKELDLGRRYGVNVLSAWRGNARVTRDLATLRLAVGDTFMVSGTGEQVRALARNPDFIVLSDASQVEDLGHGPRALLGFLLAVVPPAMGWFPLAASALASALFMVVTGCVSRTTLVRCVDWKVLALIVGTVPLGVAIEQTGLASAVAGPLASAGSLLGMPAVLAALFVLAATLSVLTSNAAAAVVVAPVAVQVAAAAGLSTHTALLCAAFGCSCNFLLPFSAANLLVMAPGGYGTRDFVRLGLPMSLVMLVVTVAMLCLLG